MPSQTFPFAIFASHPRSRLACIVARTLLSMLVGATPALAGSQTDPIARLKSMSLEDLSELEVSILGKRKGSVLDSAAAVFVITADDIRRSTATRLPELLRMVPGLNVGRQDVSEWSISARGFTGRFANKLLVMIDGRSVYSPLFSGTLWEAQDVVLEDIERIEVVRGPGAATWGANAVNGVINIITKSARDTQGLLVTALAGNEQSGGVARFGGQLGNEASYRVYAKVHDHDPYTRPDGTANNDEWSGQRAGFRTDWQLSGADSLVFQGDIHDEDADDPDLRGYNLLARWQHSGSSATDTLQLYVDRTETDASEPGIEDLHTIDFDYTRQLQASDGHAIVFGLGYRYMDSEFDPRRFSTISRARRDFDIVSLFVQDEIAISPDELELTVGAKVEHNDFSGLEFQPNIRLAWFPADDTTVWGSVSRAVRTPSRAEHDLAFGTQVGNLGPLPVVNRLVGNTAFESEEMTAYELGFRTQSGTGMSFDIALFYNDYDNLRSFETVPGPPAPDGFPPTQLNVDSPIANGLFGETYGVEIAADVQPADWWRIRAAYSYLKMNLHKRPGSLDIISEAEEGRTPEHQLSLHGAFDLSERSEFDAWLYYADHLPATGVPSFISLDLRFAHRLSRQLSVELVGRNLLDPHHIEVSADPLGTSPEQVDREFFVKLIWAD